MHTILSNTLRRPSAWRLAVLALTLAAMAVLALALPGSPAVHAQAMDDATLSDLSVGGTTVPGFDSARYQYQIGVREVFPEANVVALPTNSMATVTISPPDSNPDRTGHQVRIRHGRNRVTIRVTAQNGTDMQTYRVFINRGVTYDFGYKATDDFDTLTAAFNENPTGIWSNGATMWVADWQDSKIYAYRMSNKQRDPGKDFDSLDASNTQPLGIWSNGTTMWVADSFAGKIFAYNMSDKSRDADKDFENSDLDERDRNPGGIWSDGDIMWITGTSSTIYAYDLSDKTQLPDRNISRLPFPPGYITSDGYTLWIGNGGSDSGDPPTVEAVSLASGRPISSRRFGNLQSDNPFSPHNGIWTDGNTMWTADADDDKIYSYNGYVRTNNELNDLKVEDVTVNRFHPTRYGFDIVHTDPAELTVSWRKAHRNSSVSVRPADSNPRKSGHQVAHTDNAWTLIGVTVTAQNGRQRSYTVRIPAACHSGLGLGRVAFDPDTQECVILDKANIRVADGYTNQQAASALNNLRGWTTISQGRALPFIFGRYSPDNLTLAQLDAQLATIAGNSWAERASRDSLAYVSGRADNNAATGRPAITGTAQAGETLTADTSGISDADGMESSSFAYQWLRVADGSDAEIDEATAATYTVADDDVGNSLKVRVSFTDDEGNDESLTSAAVAVPAPDPLTGAFDGSTAPASHDGSGSFTFQLYFSEEPRLGYANVRDHVLTVTNGEVTRAERVNSGDNTRWTITAEPDGNKDVTFVLPPTTDCDADGAVCTAGGKMLSNRSVITVPGPGEQSEDPPAKPSGLRATSVSHDSVTLSWDDPGDSSITGYRILRRDIVNDPPGTFSTVADNTGTAATSYTDTTVAAGTRYAYRVVALNASGASPRSGYVNVTTGDAP